MRRLHWESASQKWRWRRKPERTQAASERKLWGWEQLLVWLNVPGQPLLCVRWKQWWRWRLKAWYCTLTAWVRLAGQGMKGERKILSALLTWHLEGAGIRWWTPWGTSTWVASQFTFSAPESTHLLKGMQRSLSGDLQKNELWMSKCVSFGHDVRITLFWVHQC